MVDMHEILGSKELMDAVSAIRSLVGKYKPSSKPENQPSFSFLALDGPFQAAEILRILTAAEPNYPGLKEVLAAGLAGWVLFPHEEEFRVNFMTHAVIEHLNLAEHHAGMGEEDLTLENDLISRYIFTDLDFLTEVYDQFGGYAAFTRSSNTEILSVLIEDRMKAIWTTAKAIGYLHYGADHFSDQERNFAPSLNRAVKVFAALKDPRSSNPYVSRSMLHKRWTGNKESLALVYAAASIELDEGVLLDYMRVGAFSYRDHREILELWLGRARYVTEHVFAKLPDEDLYPKTKRLLGDGATLPFGPPDMTSEEIRILQRVFSRYSTLS